MSGTATPREEILRNLERHDQAAGHAGVMRSGSLIIKPCTQAEIDFYALATQTQPLFAQWMPTYMGQLTLNKPGNQEQDSIGAILESERFEQAVVLENLEWGFKRPSVLDIKLGKILTDEFVSEEKRMRLEKVSMSTTSWDNHLRLTGMRVWDPVSGEHTVYPKTYGKSLTTSTLPDGFSNFFSSLANPTHKKLIVQRLIVDTEAIHAMLSSHESRMYSASILFVYEGDAEALENGIQAEAREEVIKHDEDEDEDEDDEETIPQYISKTKLIDFAHATFRDGHGADHNVLMGVQKVLEHLKMMDL